MTFRPAGNVVNRIRGETSCQAYSFAPVPIAKTLLDAHKRGVKVQVILDKSTQTEKYSAADFVAHAKIATFIDAARPIAHNKVVVIDGYVIVTGSFNFTNAAERNAQNLLVIDDQPLAKCYAAAGNAAGSTPRHYEGRPH